MTSAQLALPPIAPVFDHGQSAEAERLRLEWTEAISAEATDPSVSFGERYRRLIDAAAEASVHNWDGYGALPVDPATVEMARGFIELLPSGLPSPEISADTDGELLLEWYTAPRHVLTISIGRTERISYAVLIGEDMAHGSEIIDGEIPEPVMLFLRRLLPAPAP